MSEKKKKPAIRFKGFDDDWEQRKLGVVVDVCSGKDYKHLSEGNIPVYGTGGYMLSINEALSYNEDAIGIGRKGTIDKPYILKAPFWTVDTLFYAIPKENIDLDFVFDIFQNIEWKKKDESTGVPSLSKTAINEIDILVPKYEEQLLLGSYFKSFDTLITLHQRKLEMLKNIKQALLEKMFPKSGASTPELRFKGYTDDWEQCRLQNISDVRDGTHDSPNYISNGYPLITSKNVRNGNIVLDDIQYISKKDFDKINERSKVDINDILMGMIGTIGNIAIVSTIPYYAIKNVALIKNTGQVNVRFLFQALSAVSVSSQLAENLDGGTQKFISLTKIREIKIPFTPNNEQIKIANLFECIDVYITLHQRKLEMIQNLKKSLLEKMFV